MRSLRYGPLAALILLTATSAGLIACSPPCPADAYCGPRLSPDYLEVTLELGSTTAVQVTAPFVLGRPSPVTFRFTRHGGFGTTPVPEGVTATFSSNPVPRGQPVTVTFTAANDVAPGSYEGTVAAEDASGGTELAGVGVRVEALEEP